jgi:ubiquinone/menaquinone biosynthesis C-methylase UbiE
MCKALYELVGGEIPVFAPNIDMGKYDAAYATKYAGIWALGYETLHRGENEGLYRTVNEMVLSEGRRNEPSTILDLGCGIGRIVADCARNFLDSFVLGFDASIHMLRRAREIVVGNREVLFDLSSVGLKNQAICGAGANNVCLAQADAHSLPINDDSLDIVTSVNLIDRVSDPTTVFQEIVRALRKDGILVFTSPLNWTSGDLWQKHPDRNSMLKILSNLGMRMEEWFDGLFYREIEDARGSYTDWNTLVVKARKQSH